MKSLEERFVAAVEQLDLPSRDLVAPVLTAIEVKQPVRRTWALVPAAIALVVAVIAVPNVRTAVADLLGIGSTRVEVVDTPQSSSRTQPASVESLGTAVEASGDPIPSLGRPTELYDHPGRGRSYVWSDGARLPEIGGSGVGAVLSVREADGGVSLKTVEPGADIGEVELAIDGHQVPALWIGAQHSLLAAETTEPAIADRVLIWELAAVAYRLEVNLSLDEAVVLAESVVGGTELLPAG